MPGEEANLISFKRAISVASKCGRLDVANFLFAFEIIEYEAVCHTALVIGKLEVLRWLRSQQPPWPWNALKLAIDALMLGQMRMYA
jgi:hypothetical protein